MLLLAQYFLAATEPPPVRMKATLPGVPSTAPYEYYSGFLDAGVPPSGRGEMYFHYICAMSPDWEQKPMTLWYNGGPGAPSTYGLFHLGERHVTVRDRFTRTHGRLVLHRGQRHGGLHWWAER